MTAPDPADTVIEQAAKVLAQRSKHSWGRDLRQARDLHDAGLLADPADRDEESVQASVQPASELASYFFDRCFGIVDDPEAKLTALIEARDTKIRNEARR